LEFLKSISDLTMQIAAWKIVNEIVITKLKKLHGHFFEKLLATIFFGLCSALIVFITGAIVFQILEIPTWEGALGTFIVYFIGMVLAYKNFIFDPPSILKSAACAFIGGVLFWIILMMSSAIFEMAKFHSWSYDVYGMYLFLATVLFSLFYWFSSDLLYYS
jgi:hypothetical protein